MDYTHLIAFGVGMISAVLKDIIQVMIFNKQMNKLKKTDMQDEMDKMMEMSKKLSEGFALNEHEDKDSSNIESYYKGYYS